MKLKANYKISGPYSFGQATATPADDNGSLGNRRHKRCSAPVEMLSDTGDDYRRIFTASLAKVEMFSLSNWRHWSEEHWSIDCGTKGLWEATTVGRRKEKEGTEGLLCLKRSKKKFSKKTKAQKLPPLDSNPKPHDACKRPGVPSTQAIFSEQQVRQTANIMQI